MAHTPSPSNAPLYWLAVGTFAVGTESFMIAGLLPAMAADLTVSVATAGQLVTAFALAYALGSPILTVLTGSVARRRLLIGAMLAFGAANLLAWAAAGYWQLLAARIVLAGAAGVYVPAANAVASAVAQPGRRGSALAIVNGGLSLAIAIGVPLGALLGDAAGWRATFAGVATLSALAAAGLAFGLPRDFGAGLAVATLSARLRTASKPAVLRTLLVTTLWAMASYTTYTYLAAFIGAATTIHGAQLGFILFGWGVAAAAGLAVSARIIDSRGAKAVIVPALAVSTIGFIVLSLSAHLLSRSLALAPVLLAIVAWGMAHWAFFPAQQATLAEVAGVPATPIVLSLNASFMYLGFSLGAALGSAVIAWSSPANLGFASALCMVGAIALALSNARASTPVSLVTPARIAPLQKESP
jgi:predicted MFS family arabinose efflux permease